MCFIQILLFLVTFKFLCLHLFVSVHISIGLGGYICVACGFGFVGICDLSFLAILQ